MSIVKAWSNFWGTMAQTFRVGGPSGPPAALLGPIVGTLPTDIYLDPVAGSDLNPGTSSNAALKTFAGVLGTIGDDYGSSVIIHLLSSQAIGSERIIFNPKLRGPNTNLTIDGTPGIVYGAPFAAGTVTQFVWGRAGNAMTIAGMPGTPVVGQIITNTTRGTNAIIRKVAGATVTVTVPLTPSNVDLSWRTGDTLEVGTLPYLNLESMHGSGGDTNSSFTGGVLSLLHVRVPDVSGVSGNSALTVTVDGLESTITECVVDSFTFQPTDGFNSWVGCALLGGGVLRGTTVVGGTANFIEFKECSISGVFTSMSTVQFWGVCYVLSMACEGNGNTQVNIVDNASVTLTGSTETQGYGSIWTIGTQCHMGIGEGSIVRQALATNPGTIWSHVFDFQQFYFTSGTHGYVSGSSFVPTTGTWHSCIPLTVASLDAWGAIYDGTAPVGGVNTADIPYSGAGFIGQSSPTVPPSWLQNTWHVNYASGNAANDGLTSGTPVDSAATIRSRWGGRPQLTAQTYTFTCDSGTAGVTDPWSVLYDADIQGGGQLVFQGAAPTVAHSGTLNSASAFARTSAGGRITITDAGVSNWQPFVPVLFHDKTTGGIGWLVQPQSASTATGTITPCRAAQTAGAFAAPAFVATAGTDQYELLTLTSIYMGTGGQLRTFPGRASGNTNYTMLVSFYRLHLTSAAPFDVIKVDCSTEVSTQGVTPIFQECLIDPQLHLQHKGSTINCWSSGGTITSQSDGLSSINLLAGGSYISPFLAPGAITVLDCDFCIDVTATPSSTINQQRGASAHLRLGNCSYWGSNTAIQLTIGGSFRQSGVVFDPSGGGGIFYGTVGAANPVFNLGPNGIAQLSIGAVTGLQFDSSTFTLDSQTSGVGVAAGGSPTYVGPTTFTLPHFDAALAQGSGFGRFAIDLSSGARVTQYNG